MERKGSMGTEGKEAPLYCIVIRTGRGPVGLHPPQPLQLQHAALSQSWGADLPRKAHRELPRPPRCFGPGSHGSRTLIIIGTNWKGFTIRDFIGSGSIIF